MPIPGKKVNSHTNCCFHRSLVKMQLESLPRESTLWWSFKYLLQYGDISLLLQPTSLGQSWESINIAIWNKNVPNPWASHLRPLPKCYISHIWKRNIVQGLFKRVTMILCDFTTKLLKGNLCRITIKVNYSLQGWTLPICSICHDLFSSFLMLFLFCAGHFIYHWV